MMQRSSVAGKPEEMDARKGEIVEETVETEEGTGILAVNKAGSFDISDAGMIFSMGAS